MPLPEGLKKRPHFNFITIHYIYIIGITLAGSVIIFGTRNMPYIDALLFASGSSTQSGLNPINGNDIKTYQQFMIWLIPMLTTPIFINTCVVFVRLHWFEKRFANIVSLSRQPSKARVQTRGLHDTNSDILDGEERGVRGRVIKVLHTQSGAPNSFKVGVVQEPEESFLNSVDQDGTLRRTSTGSDPSSSKKEPSSDAEDRRSLHDGSSATINPPQQPENTNVNIQFGDLPSPVRAGVNGSHSVSSPHIAFAENSHGKALRIPGPREFEQGGRAQEVDDDEDTQTLYRSRTTGAISDDRISEYGTPASRTTSMGNATPNVSSSQLRLRKLPTLERFLPRASTVERAVTSAFTMGAIRRSRSASPMSRRSKKAAKEPPNMPYLSYQPTLGRNSQFVDLTDDQRDELGGIEYRSLKLLSKILVGYYLFFHVFGIVCLIPWVFHSPPHLDYIRSVGVHPVWWAIYTAQTCFNDVGFTLVPDSMISFSTAQFVLLSMTFLIIIGNTGFPCMLRFIIWVGFKIVPKSSRHRESLNFLLDHPRRCFTLLFPSGPTWLLFWILVILNVSDVVLFMVLDLHDPDVLALPVPDRIISALFTAASTRTSGTTAFSIANIHPAVQVSYMIMMYISVFPIAISVRRTNVYEETALGMYEEPDEETDETKEASYVGTHLRKQLSFDLWYIFLGLFVIAIAEGHRLQNTNEYAFTIFSVLFELVSAYGTVGLSMGYPGIDASFVAEFNVIAKLVIVAMQIRGRHRGLPYELDRAILLPSEALHKEEDIMARRRNSNASQLPYITRPLTARSVASQAVED